MCPDCDEVMIPDEDGDFVCPTCNECIENENSE